MNIEAFLIIELLDIKQMPRKINLRKKEVTPENLRLGLPLDQARHDEERKLLMTDRQNEYKAILAKVNCGGSLVLLSISSGMVSFISPDTY